MARINRLHEAGFLRNTISQANSEGSRRYDILIDLATQVDHSIEVKLGVHCGLFAATIRALGSPEQTAYWLPRIENFDDFGCFALTELGHGSNVRGIETRATFDHSKQSFVINTPSDRAQKYWIGGASESATFSVVFAQLSLAGQSHGIHVFIVRLRDANGRVAPGVTIADCGAKAGLNGVDNGRIWFSNCQVPRENMLSAISQVSSDGVYSSSIASPDERFGLLLGALTGGRVSIASTAISTTLLALTIAIRFCMRRTAFAPRVGEPEVPLLFYTSHRRALMIPLASALVYKMCTDDLRELWYEAIDSRKVSKLVHVLSAGYKALFTWFMSDSLQSAREACGGQGYKSENRIAPLRADRDVMLTFEGANGVLLQQISKVLLAELKVAAKKNGIFSKDGSLAHLNERPTERGSAIKLEQTFFQGVFWRCEHAVVHELGQRFAEAMKKRNGDTFRAWNDCLDVAERAARAHMQRRIYEAHLGHMELAREKGGGCDKVLMLAGKTWAAKAVSQDVDAVRLGCVTRKEATIVGDCVDGLCEEMTGIASKVVDAMGFPDIVLAPIAGDFEEYNSRARL